MLEISEVDYNKDINEIVNLIQQNLDCSYSRDFFIWKHLENPSGKSYGLVAKDRNKIVGLRMFMFWDLYTPHGNIKAIRPVDTATDKDYRGKGIFKKLTLDGLQNIIDKYDIIFNTPNKNSLPGYLKMGWVKLENIDSFKVGLVNPILKSSDFTLISINQLNLTKEDSNTFNRTLLTNEFIKWRYKDPTYKVAHFSSEGNHVIYKKSLINSLPVILIYEMIGNPSNHGIVSNSLAKKNKTPFVYYYEGIIKNNQFLMTFKRNSPVVVIKNDKHLIGDKLNFSLGDLEAKL